jgi:pyruvate/2-oxoglutarate dehydrogenase complex dihydrolipoamide acyltransferase (E2) component
MTMKNESFINLQFTIDHRFMDGALGSKIATEIEKCLTDPSSIMQEL